MKSAIISFQADIYKFLILTLIIVSLPFDATSQVLNKTSDSRIYQNLRIGTNYRIPPSKKIIYTDPTSIPDPAWPYVTQYEIKPTLSYKVGYSLGMRVLKVASINLGLELNQRKFSYDFLRGIKELDYTNEKITFSSIELPIFINYSIWKFRVSAGSNFVLLSANRYVYYLGSSKKSATTTFGIIPEISTENFIYPYLAIDYKIRQSQKGDIYLSLAGELREESGYLLSVLLLIDLL